MSQPGAEHHPVLHSGRYATKTDEKKSAAFIENQLALCDPVKHQSTDLV